MDAALVRAKLESLRRCVARIEARCPATSGALAADLDAQDIVSVNLSRAIQLCVDLALNELSGTEQPVPTTMAGAFDALAALGTLDPALAIRLKRAVGFRNLAIHQYREIDWTIVFAICRKQTADFRDFARRFVGDT
jgi:uncharacterized protein YutE (UPF0331/DUF86 family)